MRQYKCIDSTENSLDNSSIKPTSVETICFHDADAITAVCEVKAINIGR
jgi:hypothetical protein